MLNSAPEAAALSAAPKVPVMMISASRFHTKHAQAWSRMTRRPPRDVLLRHGGRARSLARQEAGNNGHEEGERVSNDLHSLGRQSGEGTKHTVS
jgi:hypothetical protein